MKLNDFSMKFVDFAFTAHFSQGFLPEISTGNLPFLPEISNFPQDNFIFLHETRNLGVLIYKHCSSISHFYKHYNFKPPLVYSFMSIVSIFKISHYANMALEYAIIFKGCKNDDV